MFSKITMELCDQVIKAELEEANRNNQPFHSLHEGWAVMKEEHEEAVEALAESGKNLDELWGFVKSDSADLDTIMAIKWRAKQSMMEAAQLAAMAQKMIHYCEKRGN